MNQLNTRPTPPNFECLLGREPGIPQQLERLGDQRAMLCRRLRRIEHILDLGTNGALDLGSIRQTAASLCRNAGF
jgi:hypothetical protein